jgi:Protein of Unknown function (DUF2784)
MAGHGAPSSLGLAWLNMWQLLADAVLLLHAAVVLFVVGGLVLVWIGNAWNWGWVNRWWFRLLHLLAIAVVVVQAWLGVMCPLTTLEWWLREQGGGAARSQGFIEYWVQRWLFYQAPPWVFTALYTVFAALVLATWWRWPPRR